MLAIGSFVQTHVIRLFSLMENGFCSSVAALFDLLCGNLLFLHLQDSLNYNHISCSALFLTAIKILHNAGIIS